jgi:hypothetical protein
MPIDQQRRGPYYYRIWDQAFAAPLDEYENPIGSSESTLRCVRYPVLAKTAKGVWIQDDYDDRERFILSTAVKQWAHPTVELALESYLARKAREIHITEARAAASRTRIEVARACLAAGTGYDRLKFRAPSLFKLQFED